MGAHKSQKRSAHITCSYVGVHAWIMLKIGMMSTTNVRKLSFKFEKDPYGGSREIRVLLHGFMSTISEASMQYSSGARQGWSDHPMPSDSPSWPRAGKLALWSEKPPPPQTVLAPGRLFSPWPPCLFLRTLSTPPGVVGLSVDDGLVGGPPPSVWPKRSRTSPHKFLLFMLPS